MTVIMSERTLTDKNELRRSDICIRQRELLLLYNGEIYSYYYLL